MTDHDRKPPLSPRSVGPLGPLERVVEIVVYVPVGIALFVRDLVPPMIKQFAARGKTRVEPLARTLGLARAAEPVPPSRVAAAKAGDDSEPAAGNS